MKTKNTPENKAIFYSLYNFQYVLKSPNEDVFDSENKFQKDITLLSFDGRHLNTPLKRFPYTETTPIEKTILELKSLSEITDEDRDDMSSVLIHNYVDYFRLKGYAVPWLDLTIEDLIDYKWIQIKNK